MKHKLVPIIGLSVLLILAVILAMVDSNGIVPSAMAAGTQDIVTWLKTDSNNIYDKIQENINKVTALKIQLETLRTEGKPTDLDAIIKDIEAVTKSYESLASQRDGIKKSLLSKIDKIQDMMNRVDDEINKLNEKRADYETRIREPSSNEEILRTRQKALGKAITYVDTEISLWQQFKSIEQDINSELLGIQETLDEFLSVIESSAILFREGLTLLELQRDINNALSLFTVDVPQMKQLSVDMENSWDTLDFLVSSLTSLSVIGVK
jgi:chromosome segregation ATPase